MYTEWFVLLISSFFSFLLALRSQNQRSDESWVCYEQLWIWCNFNISWLDSSPRHLLSRRWGNCPKFCQQFAGVLFRRLVTKRRLRRTVWKRKILFRKPGNRPTFWWKIRKCLCSCLRKRGGLVVQVSFTSVARFTIVRQMAPLPSVLNAAVDTDALAVI